MATLLNVLLIEDYPPDAELVLHELRQAGFDPDWQRVDTETDYLAHLESMPDIIISDYSMPQWTGLRALQLLNKRELDIPFIMVSGTIGEDIAVETMKQGAADYLLKDRMARLGQAVIRALEAKRIRAEKQRAEEALRLQSKIATNMAEGVYLIRVSDGVIVYTNPRFEKMFGYDPDELIGQHVSIINAPSEKSPEKTAEEIMEALKKYGFWQGEVNNIKRDGAPFWCNANVSAFAHTEYGEVWVSVHTDITQRKQAEEALKAANDQLNALINALPDRIITFDEDGRYLDMHSDLVAASHIYRQSPINQYLHDIEELPDEVADLVLSTIRQTIESDQLQTVEYRIPGDLIEWDEGRVLPLQKTVNGKRTVLWITRDISQQKVAEAQSRKYGEQVRLLYEIGKLLGNTLDLEEIYDNVYFVIYGIMPCDSLVISSYNADDKLIRCVHVRQDGVPLDVSEYPPIPLNTEGKGIQSIVIRTGESLLIADYQAYLKTAQVSYYIDEEGLRDSDEVIEEEDITRSALIIPLNHGGQVIGVIQVQSYRMAAFSEDHLRIIEALAPQVAAATANARLYQSERQQREFAETLREITTVLASTLDLDQVLELILSRLQDIVPYDSAAVFWERNDNLWVLAGRGFPEQVKVVGLSFPGDNALFQESRQTSQAIYLTDVQTDSRFAGWADTGDSVRGWLGVPLIVRGDVRGYLTLDNRHAGAYGAAEAMLVQSFAAQAAIAIDNGQLHDSVRRHADELEQRVIERTAQLQSSTSRIEAILNSSNDAIILIDLDGTIQQGNPAFNKLFGYTADESYGRPLLTLVTSESINPLIEVLHLVEESGESTRIELVARHKNGSTFDIGVALSSVRKGEAVTGIICSIHDITQRKLMERSLRTSLEKERELGDLKSRFVSMASHDLRTPLATIMATSDSLQHYFDRMNEEQKTKRFTKIRDQITHMTKMLDDVLTVGKLEGGAIELKLEMFDLNALFTEIVSEFQQTEPACQIVYSGAGECDAISADPKLTRQIITNLLSNAIKYSPEGSTVNLTLGCDEDKIVWQVKDEGIGIPVEDQERLFEPFHRAANVGTISGTGLGLAITKRAVELHGGEIICESKTDSGTTFTITMPRSTLD
jgi:PAS domain S-box-containing protein